MKVSRRNFLASTAGFALAPLAKGLPDSQPAWELSAFRSNLDRAVPWVSFELRERGQMADEFRLFDDEAASTVSGFFSFHARVWSSWEGSSFDRQEIEDALWIAHARCRRTGQPQTIWQGELKKSGEYCPSRDARFIRDELRVLGELTAL